MASIMPVSSKPEPSGYGDSLRLWLHGSLTCVLLLAMAAVHAEDFTIRAVRTHEADHVYLLNASIDFHFSERALNALASGVPITIRMDIEVERVHKYWLNESIAELEQRYRLHYHALSGLYRLRNVNSGAIQVFSTLEAALVSLGVVSDLPLIDDNLLEPGANYRARMRVSLDIESLPSPLRPWAYVSPAWRLASDWYSWSLER